MLIDSGRPPGSVAPGVCTPTWGGATSREACAGLNLVGVDIDGLMTSAQGGLLTSAVQAGFVVGTLASATLGLADRIQPKRLIAAGCGMAGAATLLLPFVEPTGWATIGCGPLRALPWRRSTRSA